MQLILAIVADQQQAAQLAALIDGRLAVELIQAAEVGEGLLALDDRIPDLILTSPLMSPFDDGVLDEYLRDLGPGGKHVQSLRIPVLSQAPKKAPRLGFSLRRRAKPEATTPDGCDPKVFADEIAQYLARAAEEKSHAATSEAAPVIERRAVREEVTAPPVSEEQWRPAYDSDAVSETAAWAAPAPEAPSSGWRSDLLDRPLVDEAASAEAEPISEWQEDTVDAPAYVEERAPIYEPIAMAHADETVESQIEVEPELESAAAVEAAPAVVESFEESPVELEPIVEAIEEEPIVEAIAEEPVARPVIADAAPAVAPIVERPAARIIAEEDPHTATPSFKAALAAIRAAWGKPGAKEESSVPAQAQSHPVVAVEDVDEPVEIDLTDAVELIDEPTAEIEHPAVAQRPFVQADAPEAPDVYEIPVEPGMNEVAPFSPEPSGDRRKKAAKRPTKNAKAKGPRPSQPQPGQDEWGVFDPKRCGFAALVDKLDEVSEEKAEKRRNNGSKARVISCS